MHCCHPQSNTDLSWCFLVARHTMTSLRPRLLGNSSGRTKPVTTSFSGFETFPSLNVSLKFFFNVVTNLCTCNYIYITKTFIVKRSLTVLGVFVSVQLHVAGIIKKQLVGD